jgi:hypothetical protein
MKIHCFFYETNDSVSARPKPPCVMLSMYFENVDTTTLPPPFFFNLISVISLPLPPPPFSISPKAKSQKSRSFQGVFTAPSQ